MLKECDAHNRSDAHNRCDAHNGCFEECDIGILKIPIIGREKESCNRERE